jgi:fructosamine-3-kinase
LIDPACYHGHAEVDLAMLTLFDAPPGEFWDAYGPLEPGWEDRRDAYQLFPALVHLRLFGSGYAALVDRLLHRLEV